MDSSMVRLSDLIINSYANYLLSQGEILYETKGIRWMNYHGALIPAAAMPVYIDLSDNEAKQVVKKSSALLLRFTTGPLENPTDWWNMVCRRYDFDRLSANTRSKIRRGTRRNVIERVSPDWLRSHAYECHVKSYQRYKHAFPQKRKDFNKFLCSIKGLSIFDIWCSFKSGELVGYIICVVESDGVFMHTIDITPEGLHDYAAYAMIHHINEYYINIKKIPVSNGSRSIAHETNMQEFLYKLGFKREYSELHVVYRSDIKLIVNVLYPFRHLFKFMKGASIVNKVSSILFQEEIVRRQMNSQT